MNKIKILIADDQNDLAILLKSFLERDDEFAVVNISNDGSEAIKNIEIFKPNVLILDLSMPIGDGFYVLDKVKENFSNLKVIVFSGHSFNLYGNDALNRGADLYLEKGISLSKIKDEIRRIAIGGL
jgi:DNA-binding NarL/FixJ family response regulator